MDDIHSSKAAYYVCMRLILLWLGVTCCGVVPWARTSNMQKNLQLIFAKNAVGNCTDGWRSFLSAMLSPVEQC